MNILKIPLNIIISISLKVFKKFLLELNTFLYLRNGKKTLNFFTQKNKEKHIELLHIYEILSVVGIELFTNLANSTNQGIDFNAEIKEQMTNYRKLCDYCNEQLAQISISYNVTVEQIGAEWKLENKLMSIRNARKLKNDP